VVSDVRQYLGRLGAECNSSSHLYLSSRTSAVGISERRVLQKTSVPLVPPPHPKRAFGGASSLRVVSSDFAISRSRPKPQLLQDNLLAVKLRNSKTARRIDRVGVDARSTVPLHTPLASRPSPALPAGVIPAPGHLAPSHPLTRKSPIKSHHPEPCNSKQGLPLDFWTTGRRDNSEQKVSRRLVSVRTRGV
jgi:hypothetical protein